MGYFRLLQIIRFFLKLSNRGNLPLFESFDIFGLFDAENHRKVDYFIANNPQIMQTLFEIICGLFATK